MKHTYHIKMRAALWYRTFVFCMLTVSTCAVVPSAYAAWFAYGDYRGCTGRGYESTPRKEGPFTKSECDLLVSDDEKNKFQCGGARFYCKEEGASDSSSSSSGESAGTLLGRAIGEALFGNKKEASPSYDKGAAQRAQEAEAAAERQRQQAEAERVERERLAEEKRQKDAAFIRDRDDASNSLKGSTGLASSELKGLSGTGLKGSGDNPYGLRDAVSDTGLKGSTPASEAQAKQAAAWKQLHCAASIAKYALAALQTQGDYNEFGTLSVEASKAMDGQRTNVECGEAPAFPNLNGKTVNMDRVIASERQLLARATVIAERMKQRGDKPGASQQPKPPANETSEEKMRRVQLELNEINSRKVTGKSQQEINQQEKDRKELAKLVIENNNLESGKLADRSYKGPQL